MANTSQEQEINRLREYNKELIDFLIDYRWNGVDLKTLDKVAESLLEKI